MMARKELLNWGILLFVSLFSFQNCSNNFSTDSAKISIKQESTLCKKKISSKLSNGNKLVAMIGDSLTFEFSNSILQNYLGNSYTIINCGIHGNTTADIKARYDDILNGIFSTCKDASLSGNVPDIVLLMAGTNNLLQNTPKQLDTFKDYEYFITKAKEKGIQILMSSVPPYVRSDLYPESVDVAGATLSRVNTLNSVIANVTSLHGVGTIDLYSKLKDNWASYARDGIHFIDQANGAYDIFAAEWAASISRTPVFNSIVFSGYSSSTGSVSNCVNKEGVFALSGAVLCSCDSGDKGDLYRCDNGTYNYIGSLGTSCVNSTENHAFLSYQCSLPSTQIQNPEAVAKSQVVKFASSSAYDELWSASYLIDGNFESCYSNLGDPSHDTWVTMMFSEAKYINGIQIQPRMGNSADTHQSFPNKYILYATNASNTAWESLGVFDAQPNGANLLNIAITPRWTYGVVIAPLSMSTDIYGGYYFQLCEVSAYNTTTPLSDDTTEPDTTTQPETATESDTTTQPETSTEPDTTTQPDTAPIQPPALPPTDTSNCE